MLGIRNVSQDCSVIVEENADWYKTALQPVKILLFQLKYLQTTIFPAEVFAKYVYFWLCFFSVEEEAYPR